MKKWLLVLGMITCMIGLTACAQKEEVKPLMTQEEADTLGRQIAETINQYVILQARDQVTDQVILSAMDSWEAAAEDMGDYVEIIGVESELDEEDGVIDVRVKGSVREAIVEIVIDKNMISSISTNVEYTFGEKMEKAALNTLLGMGTVFCVLILISLIIGCFGFIPKIQAKLTKAPAKQEVKVAPVTAPAAQVPEKDLTDDLELVAVIAAAVAASEGASSTDSFVVRSIRRAGNKWQRA
ncbi:OadG family protein [Parablautia intestinalis]|uniref:OadG family protein n=1 Tax=Parablautia intestinalis TaxID=2320100 RepID=UPI00256F45BA|nr:OadG family protein [Parablautia intestinalis]